MRLKFIFSVGGDVCTCVCVCVLKDNDITENPREFYFLFFFFFVWYSLDQWGKHMKPFQVTKYTIADQMEWDFDIK